MTNKGTVPEDGLDEDRNVTTKYQNGPSAGPQEDKDLAVYTAALERLLAQHEEQTQLVSADLREILEKRGHVPITQDNVAREAGLTRKALVPGGRFETLGTQIKEMRSSHGVKQSTTAQLSQLKADLAEARQTIVVLRSKMAEAIVRVDRAETALAEERGLAERLRGQLVAKRR